jgi:hypothetical protein
MTWGDAWTISVNGMPIAHSQGVDNKLATSSINRIMFILYAKPLNK